MRNENCKRKESSVCILCSSNGQQIKLVVCQIGRCRNKSQHMRSIESYKGAVIIKVNGLRFVHISKIGVYKMKAH